MKSAISVSLFLLFIVTCNVSAQQSDTSSYFPLGFWGIWIDPQGPPFNPQSLTGPQWIKEKQSWTNASGNYLLYWIPAWMENQVMEFADTSAYQMDISRSGYGFSGNNEKGIDHWIKDLTLTYNQFTAKADSLTLEMATQYGNRPGLYSYSLAHERPVVNYTTPAESANCVNIYWPRVRYVVNRLKQLDPSNKSYVVAATPAPRGFVDTVSSLDILQCDWYVFHDNVPKTLTPQQDALEILRVRFDSTAQRLKGRFPEWQAIIQTQREYRPVGQDNIRRPTKEEIRVQPYLALTRGSRGITSFVYGSDLNVAANDQNMFLHGGDEPPMMNILRFDGLVDDNRDPFDQQNPDPKGVPAYDYVKEVYAGLAPLGPTIRKLRHYEYFAGWTTQNPAYRQPNIAGIDSMWTDYFDPGYLNYIEVGTFKRMDEGVDSTVYFVLANRVCNRSDGSVSAAQTVSVRLNHSESMLVTEVASGEARVVGPHAAFADVLQPGSGKLYRLEPAVVSGAKSFPFVKFVGGGVLTLASNANITARGNMDTVNVVLGSNAVFKADTGSAMVIARDSALVFGSGSVLDIAGVLRTMYGNYTTVPYGATLRLRPRAVLEWGSYGSLVIEGTLSAIGTITNPITITRAPGDLAPSGIHLAYGSVDTIEHCRITELYTGVSIAYCTARIRNNEFLNCTFAISSDAFKRSPLIEGNTIDSCYIGLDVYTSSPIGTPVIQSNDIQHCDYGVVVNPSFGSTLTNNSIHYNQTGILVDGSTPVLRANIIENNAIDGIYATNYSNPRFGDYAFNDPGNNIIRYNGETQIHSHYSTPFLGEIFYEPKSNCENLDPSSTFGGFNSVYDPDGESYLVFTGKGSTVTAIGTWWGQCPPDENRFFTDGWPFYYLPALDFDSNEGMRPSILASGTKEVLESGQMDPRLRNSLLRQALVLRSRRNYTGALVLYTSVIADNLNEMDVNTALQEVRHTYHDYVRWSSDTTLQATLESYLRNQSANHPRAAIKRLARVLRASELANMGNYTGSVTEYQQLLQSSSVPAERVMHLFQLFNLNSVRLVDREAAQLYLAQMQSEFPNDGRTRIAAIRFEAMTSRTSGNGLQKPSLAANAEQAPELPREFTLSQNYPNPFNPTTTIKYGLPIDARVTLRLYDVLGREVLTLVDEQARAGYYSTTLDASKYSTGVYYYRIQAGQFSQTKKLILLR